MAAAAPTLLTHPPPTPTPQSRRDAHVRLLWASAALGQRSGGGRFEVVPQAALFHLYELADTSPRGGAGDWGQDAAGPLPHGAWGASGSALGPAGLSGGGGAGIGATGDLGGGFGGGAGGSGAYYGPGQGGFVPLGPAARGPRPVHVVSAATDHEATDAEGPGLFHGTAGRAHTFTVAPPPPLPPPMQHLWAHEFHAPGRPLTSRPHIPSPPQFNVPKNFTPFFENK